MHFEELMQRLSQNEETVRWFTTVIRFIFPVLAFLILFGAVRSLLRIPHEPEVWGYLKLPGGGIIPLTHWENIIGRSDRADICLSFQSISSQHAALVRDEDGSFRVYDLDSKNGTSVNGEKVTLYGKAQYGDKLDFGGISVTLLSAGANVAQAIRERRSTERPPVMWPSFLWLTIFQILACLQLMLAKGSEATLAIPACFAGLTILMWIYYAALRITGSLGFEAETITFFLSTLSMALTASRTPSALPKQLAAIILGMILFIVLGLVLRDLDLVKKLRWPAAALAIGILLLTLVAGRRLFGATNWIYIGGMSFQPSEIAKILYIFAGASTLERLFRKRNLTLFIILTGACLLLLAMMGDFGTASIFFITFIVIAYMRSGDFATLALICTAAVSFAGILIRFRPYILRRFSAWRYAWNYASSTGYQQTRTMSAAASGGLLGMGAGNGWLKKVAASDTDLVFGMLCEEWGLIIGIFVVLSIVSLTVFAVRSSKTGRSSYYTIAACAAGSLMIFQSCLNIFGSVDILPLTGVTLPFVSNGGSAMMSAWGLLAFIKATDTRENSSFAIRRTDT